MKNIAHEIRKKANSIIHPEHNSNKLDRNTTIDLIRKTIGVIEWIYRNK